MHLWNVYIDSKMYATQTLVNNLSHTFGKSLLCDSSKLFIYKSNAVTVNVDFLKAKQFFGKN